MCVCGGGGGGGGGGRQFIAWLTRTQGAVPTRRLPDWVPRCLNRSPSAECGVGGGGG